MADLPHTYASDIRYPETFVNAADTQFLAQKIGRNTNYLLDKYPDLQSQLGAITPVFFDPFFFAGAFGTGDHLLITTPYTIYQAIVFSADVQTAPLIATTGGFLGGTKGPPIPFVVNQSQSALARNWVYNNVAFDILNNPTYDQFVLHSNGVSVSNIYGWFIHG